MDAVVKKSPSAVTLWMIVVFGLPILVFGQVFAFDFINHGDDVTVYKNPMVASGVSLGTIWSALTTVDAGAYRPLSSISHMLDVYAFGLVPGSHHAVNIFLHALNGVLLFLLLRGWTGAMGKSAAVALLFAVHPLCVESVAWIAQRNQLLGGFLMFLTLGAYTQYVRAPSRTGYCGILFLYTLMLFAEPTLFVLPALFVLIDYWPIGRANDNPSVSKRARVLEKLPFAIVALMFGTVLYFVWKQAGPTILQPSFPVGVRISSAIVACAIYVGQAVWPANLVPSYPHPGMMPPWPAIAAAIGVLGAMTGVAVRYRVVHPFIIVGWCWYLFNVAPTLRTVYIGLNRHADHNTYIPLVGLFVIAVWGVPVIAARWAVRPRTLQGIAATAIGLFALMAYVQSSHWRNSESLWRHTAEVMPNSAMAHEKLGQVYFDHGNFGDSDTALQKAVEYSAQNPYEHTTIGVRSLNTLGTVATARQDYDQAAEYYGRAVDLVPGDAHIRSNHGEALLASGKLDEAIQELQYAVQLDDQLARAWNSLAFALILKRKTDEALEAGRHAVELEPDNAENLYHMALAEFSAERYDRALKYLALVFEIDKQFEPGLVLQTEILARRGIDPTEAETLAVP